jgi:hypothetical protein
VVCSAEEGDHYKSRGSRLNDSQNEGKVNGATLYSLIRPFLPFVIFCIGLALLIEGLIPIALPVCIIGHSTTGFPIVGRCVTLSNVALLVVGIIILTASGIWGVYFRRNTTGSETPETNTS